MMTYMPMKRDALNRPRQFPGLAVDEQVNEQKKGEYTSKGEEGRRGRD
jgi:hypothetical protein